MGSLLEDVGTNTLSHLDYVGSLNIQWWATLRAMGSALPVVGNRYRWNESVRQMLQIGVDALPMVALMAICSGFILALQGASELRRFGALHFVIDLVAVGFTRELGALLTAIAVSGRSGSAFAAEIGTMKVTEELDALKVMALEPVEFVLAPKYLAALISVPCLSIISNVFGILAGGLFMFFSTHLMPGLYLHYVLTFHPVAGCTHRSDQERCFCDYYRPRGLLGRASRPRGARFGWPLHYQRGGQVYVSRNCCRCCFHRHLLFHGEILMAIISIRDLVVEYDGRRILDGLNLDIEQGETMVLLGGSGSGKSTLLRHIIGLERPKSGSVTVNGIDIARCSAIELKRFRRSIGVAFQSAALFNSLSVKDNVALTLREHTALAPSIIDLMVWMKLAVVGLADFGKLRPQELSGGMKKRAAVARAIALDPEILVFDEPSAGLDPIVAAELDELIVLLKEAFHMTVIVVTHELPSAFRIADRIAMLYKGTFSSIGTKDQIRASENPRVRQFLDRVPDNAAKAPAVAAYFEKYLHVPEAHS